MPDKDFGKTPDYTPWELEKRLKAYFEVVPEGGAVLSGLALFLGMSSVDELKKLGEKPGFEYVVARAFLKIEEMTERLLLNQDAKSSSGVLFLLANRFGFDKSTAKSLNSGKRGAKLRSIGWETKKEPVKNAG